MNEYVPRIDTSVAERTPPVRTVPPVAPVQPGAGLADDSGSQGSVARDGGEQARKEHMASAADYARMQARIADILADKSASLSTPESAREDAQSRIEALRGEPTVIVPMLPASVDTIERAIQVAKAMAQEAALTRAAQSNVGPGTVDQLMALAN